MKHPVKLRCGCEGSDTGNMAPHHVLSVGGNELRNYRDARVRCLECDEERETRLGLYKSECPECESKEWFVKQTAITGVRRGFFKKNHTYRCWRCGHKVTNRSKL